MKGFILKRRLSDCKNPRLINLFLSAFALLCGISIYIFFRHNDYLSAMNFLNDFKCDAENPFVDFIKYYFADFLWAFSFCCAVTVFNCTVSKKSVAFTAVSVFLLGTVFEICQRLGIFRGTFDAADILMYCFASVVYVLLNLRILKD